MKYDLSVIIPARREEWLGKTIESVLANTSESCEIIAVLDGEWPMEPIPDHPRLTLIHNPVSIGQRASINRGVRASKAKYVCKMDAHVTVGPDFDHILLEDIQPTWMVIPRLFNLYVYDWKCLGCGFRSYQGPRPTTCGECKGTQFDKVVVWLPRNGEYWNCMACREFVPGQGKPRSCSFCGASKGFTNIERRVTDGMRYDSDLQFGYWRDLPTREGLAAFIHAKGPNWIPRLLEADIETPSDRLLSRVREYVATYEALPLPKKYELREAASKMLEFIRTTINKTEAGKVQSVRLLNLIELAQGHIVDTLSMLGACWLLSRDLYWEVGGCDEGFGSWGAQGTEMSNKLHLSANRVVVNRRVFYSHMFRTQAGDAFPYGIQGSAQEAAKQYSRNLWRNNAWPGQKHPLSFILEKFWPIPGWTNQDLAEQKAREVEWTPKR